MLKYANDCIINKKTIPYAECYIKGNKFFKTK